MRNRIAPHKKEALKSKIKLINIENAIFLYFVISMLKLFSLYLLNSHMANQSTFEFICCTDKNLTKSNKIKLFLMLSKVSM